MNIIRRLLLVIGVPVFFAVTLFITLIPAVAQSNTLPKPVITLSGLGQASSISVSSPVGSDVSYYVLNRHTLTCPDEDPNTDRTMITYFHETSVPAFYSDGDPSCTQNLSVTAYREMYDDNNNFIIIMSPMSNIVTVSPLPAPTNLTMSFVDAKSKTGGINYSLSDAAFSGSSDLFPKYVIEAYDENEDIWFFLYETSEASGIIPKEKVKQLPRWNDSDNTSSFKFRMYVELYEDADRTIFVDSSAFVDDESGYSNIITLQRPASPTDVKSPKNFKVVGALYSNKPLQYSFTPADESWLFLSEYVIEVFDSASNTWEIFNHLYDDDGDVSSGEIDSWSYYVPESSGATFRVKSLVYTNEYDMSQVIESLPSNTVTVQDGRPDIATLLKSPTNFFLAGTLDGSPIRFSFTDPTDNKIAEYYSVQYIIEQYDDQSDDWVEVRSGYSAKGIMGPIHSDSKERFRVRSEVADWEGRIFKSGASNTAAL